MRLQDEVRDVVRREGVIARKDHPELAGAIKTLVGRGDLVPVLPGVYARPEAHDLGTRVRALVLKEPNAVVTGDAAARLVFWPELAGSTVEAAVPWQRVDPPGFRFSRRKVPAELVVQRGPLRLTDPALTALDLCASRGGDGIDRALRARATTLARMRRALDLAPGRAGNRDRRWFLVDSRDEPWSAAERRCHRLLRQARITGWRSNLPVDVRGRRYYLDVAFPRLRLVLEIDGRLHEDEREVFENDRRRQNDLVLEGWTVLRFTWRMLDEQPQLVLDLVLEAVAALSSASRA
ncbi:Very-short-patch-repair endonuclease [Microlunatus sagamiharensis]|uniref:Very-short-patch-repair endonuclease n=1 Tax=Microlunatus sagamiharensis TaxID=546874 RepID=A0A1H2N7S8_9ACTN|nr:DUF559 domain-containing protein [Microlunatus sagamiharensis]SDV01442.1 Very-short-patch-repair endonuclease [Microlunatus sagamiharensis]